MINGVQHVSIATTDLEAMLKPCRNLLGLAVLQNSVAETTNEPFEKMVGIKGVAYRGAWLNTGNVEIRFFDLSHTVGRSVEPPLACDTGIRHIYFDVTDVQSEYPRLKGAVTQFRPEPQLPACGTFEVVYPRTPQGNIVELQKPLAGALMTDR